MTGSIFAVTSSLNWPLS